MLDLNSVLSDSMATSPLIFVLSPGVDPTNQLLQLAEQKGVTFTTIALGQGQSPHAVRLIESGIKQARSPTRASSILWLRTPHLACPALPLPIPLQGHLPPTLYDLSPNFVPHRHRGTGCCSPTAT